VAIQGINPTAAQDATKKVLSDKTVTQDDFLKLLIAQLQNQDPLKPMDNQEFAAQLATFNSLGQLIDMNEKLGSMQSGQGLANQFNAASLIGKEVVTSGNAASLETGKSTSLSYQLSANAARVVVNIYNGAGDLVRQLEARGQMMGDQTITWDGKDESGKSLASGPYNFEINAFDAAGKKVSATGRIQGIVTGVKLDGGEPLLEIGALQVPFSSVTRVRLPH
jgi:flagellar basal-body rod modification protein FlgD